MKRRLRIRKPAPSVLLLGIALTMAACAADSALDEARRNADPRALSHLVEAQELFETRFYSEALRSLDAAAARAPELADIPFLRGRILTAMRQYESAEAAYQSALEVDPNYPGAWFNLGNLHYLQGQRAEALVHYRREETEASQSTDYLVQLGRAYADLGIADSARIAYERAISADAENASAHMWLGQLLEDEGSLDEALEHSSIGLRLEPDNLDYVYVVGVQRLRTEDLEGAARLLGQAVDGMPWHYAATYNYGQALTGLGRTEEGTAYLARADTLLELREEVTEWENLVAANSHEPMLWVNYGNALNEAGRVDEAIDALTVAYSLNPQWLELQNNIANLLLARGDTLDAVNRYRGLLAVDSTLSDVWLNLGTVHALSGDYDSARRAWRAALRHDPANAAATEYIDQLPSG